MKVFIFLLSLFFFYLCFICLLVHPFVVFIFFLLFLSPSSFSSFSPQKIPEHRAAIHANLKNEGRVSTELTRDPRLLKAYSAVNMAPPYSFHFLLFHFHNLFQFIAYRLGYVCLFFFHFLKSSHPSFSFLPLLSFRAFQQQQQQQQGRPQPSQKKKRFFTLKRVKDDKDKKEKEKEKEGAGESRFGTLTRLKAMRRDSGSFLYGTLPKKNTSDSPSTTAATPRNLSTESAPITPSSAPAPSLPRTRSSLRSLFLSF